MKSSVVWKSSNRSYGFVGAFMNGCYTSAITILCFFSTFFALKSLSRGIYMRQREIIAVCLFLAFFSLVFSVITGITGRRGRASLIISAIIIYMSSAAVMLLYYVRIPKEEISLGRAFLVMIFDDKVDQATYHLYRRYRYEYLISASKLMALYFTAAILLFFAVSVLIRKYFLLAILPIAASITTFVYGYSPDYKVFILIILLAAFIKLINTETDKRLLQVEDHLKKGLYIKKNLNSIVGIIVIILLLFVTIPLSKKPEQLMKKNAGRVRDFQKRIENRLKGYTVSKDYSNTRRVSNDTPSDTGREVLSLSMSDACEGDIYLKDFSAMEYSTGEWKLDEMLFEEKLPHTLRAYDVRRILTGRIYKYYNDNASNMLTNITVSYRSKATSCALPYFYDPYSFDKGYYISEDTVVKDKKNKDYTVCAARYNNITLNDVINYDGAYLNSYISYEDVNDDRIYDENGSGSEETYTGYTNRDRSYEMSDMEREFWLWYNDYVYEYYTTVPNELNPCMEDIVSSSTQLQYYAEELYNIRSIVEENELYDIDISALSAYLNEKIMSAAEYTAAVLEGRFEYSKNPGRILSGEDPVVYFLTDGKKGYCTHFASAGAMILRKLGIPARYVSGYRVDYGSIKEDSTGNYTASVTDSDAHAWVEVYLNDIGWVPVEMTPGMNDTIRKTNSNTESGTTEEKTTVVTAITEKPSTTESVTERPQGRTTETASADMTKDINNENAGEKGDSGKSERRLTSSEYILITVIILLLLTFAAVCVMIYKLKQKNSIDKALKEGFIGPEGRENLLYLNHKTEQMMRRNNKTGRRRLSDEEYKKELITAFPEIGDDTWGKYLEILQRLNYTNDCLEESNAEEANICSKIFNSILRR